MIRRGVDVTMQGADTQPLPERAVALMEDPGVLESLTMQCVAHNMELMDRLTGQRSFASLLEQARGETNWRRLRAYLGCSSPTPCICTFHRRCRRWPFSMSC